MFTKNCEKPGPTRRFISASPTPIGAYSSEWPQTRLPDKPLAVICSVEPMIVMSGAERWMQYRDVVVATEFLIGGRCHSHVGAGPS